MGEQIPVSDIAREHRLRRLPGCPANLTPALRICLANCAALRKKRERMDQSEPDCERFAAGDSD